MELIPQQPSTAEFHMMGEKDYSLTNLLPQVSTHNVEFVITINTEGSYFCNNSIGQSNLQEIVGK